MKDIPRWVKGSVPLALLGGLAIAATLVPTPTPPEKEPQPEEIVLTLPPPLANLPLPTQDRLISEDGQIAITLPSGWVKDDELNDRAQLEASNRAEQMYLIVLTQPKAEFRGMPRETYAEITRGYLTRRLEKSEVSSPTPVSQVGGNPAVQYQVRGSLNNIDVLYLHTVVETPTRFAQILAWTPPADFEKNQPMLQQVIQSFQEQQAGS
ncbi:hypothetical protein [Thermoleptolyngbya sp. M55_K2018_002]|uniref:hypothetical protein n=1 Tax=Thermoleptolyngbya sp. M55_K2018_002 TaxID=2747808 RepID=UPI0019E37B38|nr:hypothetical protein [Thermoleptolyngbya sp. M55_K2018_002]HIK42508.1 hypothetical protein [Thermoleptolyngbya sp. M55_K2018_002]